MIEIFSSPPLQSAGASRCETPAETGRGRRAGRLDGDVVICWPGVRRFPSKAPKRVPAPVAAETPSQPEAQEDSRRKHEREGRQVVNRPVADVHGDVLISFFLIGEVNLQPHKDQTPVP
ncbi:hypothetical protein D3C85_1341410 [compost metagenome]